MARWSTAGATAATTEVGKFLRARRCSRPREGLSGANGVPDRPAAARVWCYCRRMKRTALGILAVLSACGGGELQNSPLPKTGANAGNGADASFSGGHDASLEFRRAFSNPGGMWMPQQLALPQHAELLAKLGVKMDAKTLSDPLTSPLGAIVFLGGCTGSFVSGEGLVVTNHHCVQRALQLNSTPEQNLVVNGFLAKTKAEEKSAGPSQRVMVAQNFKDVTKDMRDGLDKIKDPIARKDEVDKRQKELVAACEKDRTGVRCQVSSFFDGGQYELIEMLEIKDVRLVYVPARSVGDYGGEIDNWAWPRHTGDWSFYRAYVGKDGKPAEYSPDNVPYKPKHALKVTTAGLRPNDFVMVTGYPYTTERTETASEVHDDLENILPRYIAFLKERYALAEAHLADGGETAIKAGVLKQGVQNGIENYEGVLAGMKKGDLLKQKDDLDKKVKAWAQEPGNAAQKANLDKLEAILAERRKTDRTDFERGQTLAASRLLGTALGLTRWSEERDKKDADRKPGYQDRDMPRALANQKELAKSYDRTLDRGAFRLMLVRAVKLPEAERPWLAVLLGVKAGVKIDEALVDKTLDAWYGAQLIEDEKLRVDLLQHGNAKLLAASKDPFIQAAQRIWPIYKAEEKKTDARAGELILVRPTYAEGLKKVLGSMLAPDANATLRITYGTVRSLVPGSTAPADVPFTVASQIVTKATGKEPFDAPAKLTDAIKAKKFGKYADASLGGELPINFLSDLDITGGNSGSPTLNDRGEFVGLVFDGNIEGVASNVVFNGATTRSIHEDARYMIWTMDTLDGAKHLVTEMGLPVTP